MSKIPGDTQRWATSTNSNLFGHVVRTKNMDFSTDGYASLARKAMALYSTDSDADFGARVPAIIADASLYYVVTTGRVFTVSLTSSAITIAKLAATNTNIQTGSDAVMFNGVPHVSTNTKVESYAPSTWTDRITGFSSSYPHPLCVIENRIELAVANGNVVTTYNTSYSLQNTLTLPSKYVVTSMRWKRNDLYIGTRTIDGSEAMVFIWNGSGTQAQQGHPIGADWAYSLAPYQSSIAVLTSAGQCLIFNGGGFNTLFNLPIYYKPYGWSGGTALTNVGKCLNRGMMAVGDMLYFNIDGEPTNTAGGRMVDQPSGLWVYDPKVGPYHKAGFASEKFVTATISSLASSIFTMPSAHGLQTGDAVWASSVTNIAALTTGQLYYAIYESTTAFKLALSPADALAGRSITASGTLSGDTVSYDVLSMTGNTVNCVPGAISNFNSNRPNLFLGSDVFFGGGSQDPDGNTISSFMSLGAGRNVGSFVTALVPSSSVRSTLQSIVAKLSTLHLDTDKIVIKYRTMERFGLPTPLRYSSSGRTTWVDGTSFTIDPAYKDIRSIEVGDEVEIVEGAAAGYSAHITAINDNSSPYTYTLDETITGGVVGDLSDVYVDNWTRLATISSTTQNVNYGFFEQSLGKNGVYFQFKFEVRGVNISISMLDFINAAHK